MSVDRSRFRFDLPEAQIAQEPLAERSAGRLLVVDRRKGTWRDAWMRDLPKLLMAGDLLVFNDTRVIKARLLGQKETGGRAEALVERMLDERRALAQLKASKTPRIGTVLRFGTARLTVIERRGGFWMLESDEDLADLMEREGHVPLPPYIRRPDRASDSERYQTVYARKPGAVAAPTAGLHFDEALLESLAARGVAQGYVTLHVGAGTFQPVRVERVEDHRMHSERYLVPESLARAHATTRASGRRVVAVGTTSLRALEASFGEDGLEPGAGETDLFIRPGGPPVRSIDALLTNFHLPESTLLMLVCALAGTDLMLAAYRHAVGAGYRFFSYGDAMLIL